MTEYLFTTWRRFGEHGASCQHGGLVRMITDDRDALPVLAMELVEACAADGAVIVCGVGGAEIERLPSLHALAGRI
jgi:hypothetical protein